VIGAIRFKTKLKLFYEKLLVKCNKKILTISRPICKILVIANTKLKIATSLKNTIDNNWGS
jgi:hypothetical protein